MAQAQASPAFILEENPQDFFGPLWVHVRSVLSKRVFPNAFPAPCSLGLICELKCMMGWQFGVGSGETPLSLIEGVLEG